MPAKPMVVAHVRMIAYVVAVAVATVAATALGGSLAHSTPELVITLL